jgi:hypothetical protein
MEKTYNQLQYMRANIRRTKCRMCKRQIIWMRTTDGRAIAVDPIKLINREPGVRIIGEDGVILINSDPKIGWREHQCQHANRRLGGNMTTIGREVPNDGTGN